MCRKYLSAHFLGKSAHAKWGAAMLRNNTKLSGQPKIGELFVEAGLVKPQTVQECLVIAKRSQLPLGRILIMSGFVTAPDVDCALESQKLLRAGQTTRESAQRLLRAVHCNKITIEEAKALETFEQAFAAPLGHVGKLLLAAQILSEDVLHDATARSSVEHVTVGFLLVRDGSISQAFLTSILNCAILVRDNKLTRAEAAKVLKSLHENADSDLNQSLRENNLEQPADNRPRLLDFLQHSALIAESDITNVLETALESGWQTGQVLLLHNHINDLVLNSALQLQDMLAAGDVKLARAIELLHLSRDMDTTLESLLAELDGLNQVVAFLRRGHILNEGQIRQIAAVNEDFEGCAGAILVREGVLNHEMLTKGIRCLSYFRAAALTEQQAISAFKYSIQMKVTPEEAVMQINWDTNNRYGSSELLGKTA